MVLPAAPRDEPSRWGDLPKPASAPGVGLDTDDLDLGELGIDEDMVNAVNDQIARASAEQISARLLRLERSVLRQERISLEILAALKKILAASRKGQPNGAGHSDAPKT